MTISCAQKTMNERSLTSQRGLKNFQMSARTKISTALSANKKNKRHTIVTFVLLYDSA